MGKQKHSKVKGFLHISREAEIHKVPKYGKNEFPWQGKSMVAHRCQSKKKKGK